MKGQNTHLNELGTNDFVVLHRPVAFLVTRELDELKETTVCSPGLCLDTLVQTFFEAKADTQPIGPIVGVSKTLDQAWDQMTWDHVQLFTGFGW